MTPNANLFAALRANFSDDLDACAIELADGPEAGQRYSWRDIDRATAMIANLLDELERRDLQTGLATLCVGAGMGTATIIERI